MTEYMTEQEQIELLKSWIKQYSLVIVAGVAIAIAVIFGWRYWQQYQQRTYTHASRVYDEMLTVRAQNDANSTYIQAEKLFTHYSNTVYAQMAAFMLARYAVLDKNYPEAEKHLNWILDHSKVNSMRQIARLRLARILLAEQKPEDALNILKKVNDKSFNGLTNEIRGDAYLVLKNTEAARSAYQQALKDLPNAELVRPLLQMKYDNLA